MLYTQVPNQFFSLLTILTEKELKVLLVILRQTFGWIDKDGQRKKRDWISQRFFMLKTGLSNKSVSEAIARLSAAGLIRIESRSGFHLKTKELRRGVGQLFYTSTLATCEVSSSEAVKYLHNTKETLTKEKVIEDSEKNKIKRLSDLERYRQILREKGK